MFAGYLVTSSAAVLMMPLLAVYSGAVVNALTVVASNDDYGSLQTSRVLFSALAGTTYQIAVDGYGGATAQDVLNLIEIIKRRAKEARNLELETEVEILGDEVAHPQ